jgi:hypothetical protein
MGVVPFVCTKERNSRFRCRHVGCEDIEIMLAILFSMLFSIFTDYYTGTVC